jgi:hypothetical protein
MKDNIPPEEKLLKYLRKPKPQQNPLPAPVIHEPAKQARPSAPRRSFFQVLYTDGHRVRQAAVAVLVLSFIFVLFSFLYPFWGLKAGGMITAVDKVSSGALITPPLVRGLDSYLGPVAGKNIFAAKEMEAGLPVQIGVSDLSNLQLVGIISGENPQAVIEDKKTQKSFYASKGQSIGDFQVADILEGKVILSRQGRQYELNF